ncbi:MAG: branched-chain amino acid ABC transporter permease [Ilumatobacteraceae bacterium]
MPIRIKSGGALHWVLRAVVAVVLGLLVWQMVTGAQPSSLGKYTEAMALAIAALSLNLLFGFNGQISLGHSTFAGISAFFLGYSVRFWDNKPFVSLIEACVLCFIIGMVIGLPALRLKGPYLALVTLAVAYVWPTLAGQFIERKVTSVTGESALTKFRVNPPTWTGLKNTRQDRALYLFWVALVLMVICYVIVRNVRKSRAGRSLVAVRDNETAAAVMGVNLARTKTLAFGLSASIAGVSGWLIAAKIGTVDENSFTILTSIKYILALILGGVATLSGPIVGAFAYFFADDYLKRHAPNWDWLPGKFGDGPIASFLLGVLVIASVFVAPQGVVGLFRRIGRKIAMVVPEPIRVEAMPPSTEAIHEPIHEGE